MKKTFKALGLMSGTSCDGIDAAMIETDGRGAVRHIGASYLEYTPEFREKVRACLGNRKGAADPYVAEIERELTLLHARAVKAFLQERELSASFVDLIGFHGQTILHDPAARLTIQLGDGALLAAETGIDVVNDFRSADVRAGGQGAPLIPLYHRALAAELPKPFAVVNIGGISNVTLIRGESDDDLFAFDTGPGNAMINDWVQKRTGAPYDTNGALAAKGKVDEAALERFLSDPYFRRCPPKSLDRDYFSVYAPDEAFSLEDGAATLTAMTAASIARGLELCDEKFEKLYLTGGGRHNAAMRDMIGKKTGAAVLDVDSLGWRGDAMEAEGFAYLAVRAALKLPLSLPNTTGASHPVTGGVRHEKDSLSRH